MANGVKCSKCGMVQLSSPKCKSCGALLGNSVDRPIQTQADTRARGPTSGAASRIGAAVEFPEVRDIQRLEKYDLESVFPSRKGFLGRKATRKKIALLTRLSPLLARILGEQERVLFVARGIIQYLMEIFLGNGWLTYCYNMQALVFTDRRIILINITAAGQPKHMIHQIQYGDIQSWKGPSVISGAVILKLNDGTKLTLVHILRRDARAAKELVGRLRTPGAVAMVSAPAESFQNLCPSCFIEVPKATLTCPGCRTAFKTPKKAALRSFLLPGWGDIYLTHRLLGAFELLGSAALVIFFLMTMMTAGVGEAMVFLGLIPEG